MTATSVLRDRSLRALLAAEVVSTTGGQMTWLALPWFVLFTSGSATRMTFVIAAELIGLGALGLPGAKVLGRLGARRTMLLCDGARAPLMLLLPLLHWSGVLSFPALLAVAFGVGALTAPYFAAQKLILPELLGEDERRVSEANALFQGATRLTLLLGPVAGGALIAAFDAPIVLVIDAATYVVGFTLVALFVPHRPPVVEEDADTSIRAGLRFLVHDPLLRVWSVVFALGDAAWTAFFATVPVLVVVRFDADPRIAGWLLASFGAGALIGNGVAYRFLLKRVDGLRLIAVCIMGQALPLWLLTMELPAAALSGALVVSGVANGLVNPSLHTISTLRVPAPLRPAVMSVGMLLWAGVNPLGLFGVGPVLDAAGPEPVLVAFAATQTVMMAVVALSCVRAAASPRPLTEQA
ncbi:MAG: MFS transporter [Actinomycetota bacterium]|nr:MFS transporter [Actinomycetota bacterium]